jgi:hypothetical protein
MKYGTQDGKEFTDKNLYLKHQHEINMRKLEIINKRSWLDAGLHWLILGVFIAGYLFGWFVTSH